MNDSTRTILPLIAFDLLFNIVRTNSASEQPKRDNINPPSLDDYRSIPDDNFSFNQKRCSLAKTVSATLLNQAYCSVSKHLMPACTSCVNHLQIWR